MIRIKDKENIFREDFREATEKYINVVTKHMEISDNALISKITESNFVYGYLGMFVALAKNNRDQNALNSPAFKKWMELTAGGKKEVTVVDDDNPEKALYNVPALFGQPTIDYDKIESAFKGITIRDIPFKYQQECNYMPACGDRFIGEVVAKLNSCVTDSNTEARERWTAIFKRYQHGYEPKKNKKPVQQAPEVQPVKVKARQDDTEGLW